LSTLEGGSCRSKITNGRQFSHGFQEQLNALGPDFQSCINHDAGEISIRPREVRRKAVRDRIANCADHWNAGSQRHDLFDDHHAERQNDIGTACDDLASEVAEAVELAERRISLHDQILPLDKTEPVQLIKVCLVPTTARQSLGRFAGMENGEPLYAGRPRVRLRAGWPGKAQRCGGRRSRDEFPPSHVFPVRTTPCAMPIA
jgi:hypothetical protein